MENADGAPRGGGKVGTLPWKRVPSPPPLPPRPLTNLYPKKDGGVHSIGGEEGHPPAAPQVPPREIGVDDGIDHGKVPGDDKNQEDCHSSQPPPPTPKKPKPKPNPKTDAEKGAKRKKPKPEPNPKPKTKSKTKPKPNPKPRIEEAGSDGVKSEKEKSDPTQEVAGGKNGSSSDIVGIDGENDIDLSVGKEKGGGTGAAHDSTLPPSPPVSSNSSLEGGPSSLRSRPASPTLPTHHTRGPEFTGLLADPRLEEIRREMEEIKLLEYYDIDRMPVLPVSPILMSGEYLPGDASPMAGDGERYDSNNNNNGNGAGGGDEQQGTDDGLLDENGNTNGRYRHPRRRARTRRRTMRRTRPADGAPAETTGTVAAPNESRDGGEEDLVVEDLEGDAAVPTDDHADVDGEAGNEGQGDDEGGSSIEYDEDEYEDEEESEDTFRLPPMKVVLTAGPDWEAIGFRVTPRAGGDDGDVIIEHGSHVALEALNRRREQAAQLRAGTAGNPAPAASVSGLPVLVEGPVAVGYWARESRKREMRFLVLWVLMALLAFVPVVVAIAAVSMRASQDCLTALLALPIIESLLSLVWLGVGTEAAISSSLGRRITSFVRAYRGPGWRPHVSLGILATTVIAGIASIFLALSDEGVECRDGARVMWNVVVTVPICTLVLMVPTHIIAGLAVSDREAVLEDARLGES